MVSNLIRLWISLAQRRLVLDTQQPPRDYFAGNGRASRVGRERKAVFAQPRTLEEALALLAAGDATILGGGTDIYPAHAGRPLPRNMVSLSRIAGIRGIEDCGSHVRIGGGATWSDILRVPLPEGFAALKLAAREVGSVQIQNRGTIAGNLCNASPAADGIPPLLALDAAVELTSAADVRRLPLSEFIIGYRRTARQPGEILTAVILPKSGGHSVFVKLGARRYLVISIIMVAALVERTRDGAIASARVAVGAASPVAQRLSALERDLEGLASSIRPSTIVTPQHVAGLTPIDDVRSTARYRLEAACPAIGTALDLAWEAAAP